MMDLYSLTPTQFKIAVYLTAHGQGTGRVTTGKQRIADDTGISPATVARSLQELIKHGVIERIARGQFAVPVGLIHEPKDADSLVSPMRLIPDFSLTHETNSALSTSSSNSNKTNKTKETAKALRAKNPERIVIVPGYEDDTDELAAVGFGSSAPERPVRKRRRDETHLEFLNKPRSEWSIKDNVNHLTYRVHAQRPDLPGAYGSRTVLTVLRQWQIDHGLSCEEIARATDSFTSNPKEMAALRRDQKDGANYLQYLKHYQPEYRPTESTEQAEAELAQKLLGDA